MKIIINSRCQKLCISDMNYMSVSRRIINTFSFVPLNGLEETGVVPRFSCSLLPEDRMELTIRLTRLLLRSQDFMGGGA